MQTPDFWCRNIKITTLEDYDDSSFFLLSWAELLWISLEYAVHLSMDALSSWAAGLLYFSSLVGLVIFCWGVIGDHVWSQENVDMVRKKGIVFVAMNSDLLMMGFMKSISGSLHSMMELTESRHWWVSQGPCRLVWFTKANLCKIPGKLGKDLVSDGWTTLKERGEERENGEIETHKRAR